MKKKFIEKKIEVHEKLKMGMFHLWIILAMTGPLSEMIIFAVVFMTLAVVIFTRVRFVVLAAVFIIVSVMVILAMRLIILVKTVVIRFHRRQMAVGVRGLVAFVIQQNRMQYRRIVAVLQPMHSVGLRLWTGSNQDEERDDQNHHRCHGFGTVSCSGDEAL